MTVVLSIDDETGEMFEDPQIVARGVLGLSRGNGFNPGGSNGQESPRPASDHLIPDAKRVIASGLIGASRQTLADESLLKEHLRVELKRFIQKRTGAKPVITIVIVKALDPRVTEAT